MTKPRVALALDLISIHLQQNYPYLFGLLKDHHSTEAGFLCNILDKNKLKAT